MIRRILHGQLRQQNNPRRRPRERKRRLLAHRVVYAAAMSVATLLTTVAVPTASASAATTLTCNDAASSPGKFSFDPPSGGTYAAPFTATASFSGTPFYLGWTIAEVWWSDGVHQSIPLGTCTNPDRQDTVIQPFSFSHVFSNPGNVGVCIANGGSTAGANPVTGPVGCYSLPAAGWTVTQPVIGPPPPPPNSGAGGAPLGFSCSVESRLIQQLLPALDLQGNERVTLFADFLAKTGAVYNLFGSVCDAVTTAQSTIPRGRRVALNVTIVCNGSCQTFVYPKGQSIIRPVGPQDVFGHELPLYYADGVFRGTTTFTLVVAGTGRR